MSNFTPQQSAAINGPGNLLVVAGAGTGKTHTLIARCLRLILDEKIAARVSVETILMVTFTEAAAAEMRGRLRAELLKRQAAQPDDEWIAQQLALLDAANIGTLHSFCLQLAREHFHELELDPQFTVLDDSQTRPLQRETLDGLLEKHYPGRSPESAAVRELIRGIGRGADGAIRKLVLKLHAYSQSLPDPSAWLDEQVRRLGQPQPDEWRELFVRTVAGLHEEWGDRLKSVRGQTTALKLSSDALASLPPTATFPQATKVVAAIVAADGPENWPRGTKGKFRDPLDSFFEDARFLGALIPDGTGDPLAQDWDWARQSMTALLALVREFSADFAARKREFGGVDFTDLEQCALRLLRDAGIAAAWRERLAHIFVDEYQDINAAQDAILSALGRAGHAGNRFLVGDVKQSIYRFRLANPRIFQCYHNAWSTQRDGRAGSPLPADGAHGVTRPAISGQALALTENFRSRQALLDFVNPLFAALMRPEIGGVEYEPLDFGAAESRPELAAKSPRVEFHLIAKSDATAVRNDEAEASDASAAENSPPDLLAVEREARLIAKRFHELRAGEHQVWDKSETRFRAVKWSDMAVLLRSPSGRAEAFAKEFNRAGIPLNAARDGFFASLEVSDLLNLLRLLDNPLQDVPLAAVLRSPLVGLSADELVEVRLADRRALLWTALNKFTIYDLRFTQEQTHPPRASDCQPAANALRAKLVAFLDQFHRWRALARQTSLSQTLETALNETHYEPMLRAGARGAERLANVRRLLDLARQFDPYQRQGLYRFLRFVRLQEDEELDLEPASPSTGDAVRLLSIHKSKGLEFPVVAIAGMGTNFNEQDLSGAVLLDEHLGLCPRITPPGQEQSYASLPHKLARRQEQRELRGEELRLLYVAMTRARDTLLLVGTTTDAAAAARWESPPPEHLETHTILAARCHLDWLRLWLPQATKTREWQGDQRGANDWLTWQIIADSDSIFRNGHSLPQDAKPIATDSAPTAVANLTELKARLNWIYPHEAATREPAKTSVTALRKRVADETDDESRRLYQSEVSSLKQKVSNPRSAKLSAAEVGIAHHAFQEFVAIERTATELDLRNEAEQLRAAGALSEAQFAALDFGALTGFWQSEVGVALRKLPPATINREMPFTARIGATELRALRALGSNEPLGADDFIVVQGQVDLAVLLPEEIWLLDFKTDDVAAADLPGKVKQYAPQLEVYARALENIYRRPVTHGWLHFLRARTTVEL